MYELKIK